ncbi:MAG: hypothetical protein AAFQ67_04050 [Pseudomonadota bacterium]
MLRLISLLLLVGGLAAAAAGVYLRSSHTVEMERLESVVRLDNAARVADEGSIIVGLESAGATGAQSFVTAPIAYEAPSQVVYGQKFQVTLSVNATGQESAASDLPNVADVVEAEAQVTGQLKATLSGLGFDIVPVTPEEQALSPVAASIWRWTVRGEALGEQTLTLDLFAVTGEGPARVRTFSGPVVVEVDRIRQAMTFAEEVNPLAMVLGGIGSAFAGLFGAVRFFRK